MLFQLVVVKHFAIRLKELQKGGILERQVYNEISPMVEYKLTVKGQEIVESLIDLLHLDEKMVFKFKGGLIYSAVVGIVVFLLSLVCKYPTNHKHKKKQADLNV